MDPRLKVSGKRCLRECLVLQALQASRSSAIQMMGFSMDMDPLQNKNSTKTMQGGGGNGTGIQRSPAVKVLLLICLNQQPQACHTEAPSDKRDVRPASWG